MLMHGKKHVLSLFLCVLHTCFENVSNIYQKWMLDALKNYFLYNFAHC